MTLILTHKGPSRIPGPHAKSPAKNSKQEPGAVEEMMELLDKANGNMFSIMTNPKFQKLAQKMMEKPVFSRKPA